MSKLITVKMTMGQAKALGIVFCQSCGHPPNNHFDFTSNGIKKPCAHCLKPIKGEKMSSGTTYCLGYKPAIWLPK